MPRGGHPAARVGVAQVLFLQHVRHRIRVLCVNSKEAALGVPFFGDKAGGRDGPGCPSDHTAGARPEAGQLGWPHARGAAEGRRARQRGMVTTGFLFFLRTRAVRPRGSAARAARERRELPGRVAAARGGVLPGLSDEIPRQHPRRPQGHQPDHPRPGGGGHRGPHRLR